MTKSAAQPAPRFLALSCVGFIASLGVAAPAHAQSAAPPEEEKATELQGVTVTDSAIEDDLKVEKLESPKAVAPLLDTPQTVTVISNQTLRQQNLLTLRDALATIPGITFGAGEGGGGFGDSINLRGFPANGDITQDGVRDSAQYSRTDPFDLQQIEVYNGANSVFNGSGSVGGTINLVSKRPQADSLTVLQGGAGTDDYYRGTVDSNLRLNDLVAVRLNAMAHRNDVPDRDVERFKRWGVAPSVTLGIAGPTRLTLSYYHQEDRNTPQYGVPYFFLGSGLPGDVDLEGYYGYRNLDKQKINVDRLTAIFDHDFSDTVALRNLTRFQDVTQLTIASQPQGTFCLSETGLQPTGAACRTAPAAATVVVVPATNPTNPGARITTVPASVAITVPRGYFLPSGRGVYRDTRNQAAYNQTDLRAVVGTGGFVNTINIGVSALWEKFDLDNGSVLRNADGSNPFDAATALRHQPFINIANPGQVIVPAGANAAEFGSNLYTGPDNYIQTGRGEGEQHTYAIYLFDQMKLGDMFELNGGVRYERVSGRSRTDVFAVPAAGGAATIIPGAIFRNKDTLFSYRVGAIFKPVPNASLYVAYGNSKTPSKATVNGACTADTCNVKPENARNYEVGAKWDVLAGVQLTAALFRNDRNNYRVVSNDPLVPDQVLDGASRVDGIALGASGRITEAWQIFANYTYLDSKIRQGVSDFCLANPTTAGCITTIAAAPVTGADLTNTPEHSGSLFTTYLFPFGLQVGYGATYQGEFILGNTPATRLASGAFPRSKDYLIHRLFASYTVTGGLTAQVNIQNLTDKTYFTRYRNSANGWTTPGDGRSAVLSLFYSF